MRGVFVDPLANLYWNMEVSQRVVTDAGLDPGDFGFVPEAKNNWFEILRVAALQEGGIEAIVGVALKEYPDNEGLALALGKQPLQTSREGEQGAPPEVQAVEPEVERLEPERLLVDRAEVAQLLRSEIESVNSSRRGRTLILVGDSGVGKSRLAERATRVARETGILVLQAQCLGKGAQPLFPIRECLDSARVLQILAESSVGGEDSVRFARSFIGVNDPSNSVPPLGGSGDGVYVGLAKILLGLAAGTGLCLVVEDLTDADQDTLFFLEYFRRKALQSRVITILTAKLDLLLLDDEVQDLVNKWTGEGNVRLDVPPLDPPDAAEFIRILRSDAPLAEDQVQKVVNLSNGNPFFIEQMLRLVAEDPDVDASLVDVPQGVEAVLHRRLQRIDQDLRTFLDAASVALESDHVADLIDTVAEIDRKGGLALLRRARELGCLAEDAQGGVTFVQEMLRRVVYEDIDISSRRVMHGRAAEWLEKAGLLASAALHYEHAERTEELVRTAMLGAERAEHGGMHRSALQLYERARPFVELPIVGTRMARAHIHLGEWTQADELLDQLPPDAPEVLMLRSDLFFVRGNFDSALREMKEALNAPGADRVETLIRLGGIYLHLGELGTAAEYAREALEGAKHATAVVRCEGLLGAAAFFGGDIDEGERHFVEAMTVLSAQPRSERDQTVHTTILGNLGQAKEARMQWAAARQLHEEALSVRRTVSDARGELQSLHAVARCEIGTGSIERGLQLLEEAVRLASDLGARLEQGKIDHTFAQVELLQGLPTSAVRLAEEALRRFRELGVTYDVAHARFTLATAFAATGAHRREIEEGAKARTEAQSRGFGLLTTLFPQLAFSYRERVEAGLVAYACGDALGLPWEGMQPDRIDPSKILSLPTIGAWPKGGTSDDTALTLLVAEHLVASGGGRGSGFLELLAARAPAIRGLGPSTTEAIEHFRTTGRPPAAGGDTNGALMRSLPLGWALSLDRVEERRASTIELSRMTHPSPDACSAACVGAACAAWAIEGASSALLLDVAREEAAAVAEACGADERIGSMLSAVAAGQWAPSSSGTTLDPGDTLASVLWCIREEPSLPVALVSAVRIGGDTDTIAALVGGLLGCQLPPEQVLSQLPWAADVQMPDGSVVEKLAGGMTDLRSGRAGS